MARAETARPNGSSADLSLLDMSLVDSSGVRELTDQFGATRRRGADDSESGFADPSLVVRLQNRDGREELEPPARRRSTTDAEEQAVSLFDLPSGPSQPAPDDGSLFGEIKRNRPRRRRIRR